MRRQHSSQRYGFHIYLHTMAEAQVDGERRKRDKSLEGLYEYMLLTSFIQDHLVTVFVVVVKQQTTYTYVRERPSL